MPEIKDLDFKAHPAGMGGTQAVVQFPNGYGASIITGYFAYSGNGNPYEIAVLHNDKATGIKNGKRVYGNIITVRIVVSEDAVTATAKEIEYKKLFKISNRITDELPTVVRCLYDVTDKPPATIEFE